MSSANGSAEKTMPKLLVLQHVAHEILGTLDPLLRSYGFRNRYVNFGREPGAKPSVDGYHGLVILGGPMNVDQVDQFPHLAAELNVVREALDRDIPILGICLGSQLLARALGSAVYPNVSKEIGWYPLSPTGAAASDPLLGHLRDPENIFQWHGDTFDIPESAVHLASSPSCRNQAFRYGDRTYGFQFHLEVDSGLIHRWLSIPAHRDEIAALDGQVCPDEIRAQTVEHVDALQTLADRVFTSFIRLFGDLRKREPSPHR